MIKRIFFLLLVIGSCSKDSDSDTDSQPHQGNPIYLADNGVTIKCYDWGNFGDTGEVNGIIYYIVDETLLRKMVESDEDLTKVCTTKITDMSEMFKHSNFNQAIGSWDVSIVTDMSEMFEESSFNQEISSWDVGSVTTMARMFAYSPFNQAIGSWDVGNVTFCDWFSLYTESTWLLPKPNFTNCTP